MPDPAPTPIVLKLHHPVATTAPLVSVAGFAVPGIYTIQLIVVDNHGLSSQPATVQVQVKKVVP